MSFREDHEMHGRRRGRNLGVGLVLAAFVSLVFGLTLVKVQTGGSTEAFDHTVRPALVPQSETPTEPQAETQTESQQ